MAFSIPEVILTGMSCYYAGTSLGNFSEGSDSVSTYYVKKDVEKFM